MHRRIVVLVATLVALGVLAPAASAWSSSASPQVGYAFQCSNNRVVKLTVTGNTSISTTNPPRIRLTAVRFKLINSFGPITVNAATFTVPDPNNVSAPYFGGAATGAGPVGWAGAHVGGALDANFTGPLAVAAGGTFMNALLKGKYTDSGPPATVISFRPGPFSLTLAPNTLVTCSPMGVPPAFASVTE